MKFSLGSNIASLRAQRVLNATTNQTASVQERLSSGARINRASDDAASLAIANSLSAKSRIFTQGIRNFNDGTSAINIADSAMESLTGIAVRLKELATQSANGTFGYAQRASIDKEAQALSKEYNRIVRSTSFNNINLLDGSTTSIRLQGGIGVDASLAVNPVGDFQRNVSEGGFGAGSTGAAGFYSSYIIDLDNDGFADRVQSYIISNFDRGGIRVDFGNGDGTFRDARDYEVGYAPRGFTFADFNNDGLVDIAGVSSVSGAQETDIMLLKADKTFSLSRTAEPALANSFLSTTDFNNDGNIDLVVVDNGSSWSLRLGDGRGGFSQYGPTRSEAVGGGIAFGDLNGDGIEDALLTSHIGNTVLLSRNGQAFQTSVGGVGGGGTYYNSPVITDFNGDGKNDIGYLDPAGIVRTYLGDGQGGFGALQTSDITGGTAVSTAQWGYFNGDEHLDVVTSSAAGGTHMSFGDGAGRFSSGVHTTNGTDATFSLADVNGDGVLDYGEQDGTALTIQLGRTATSSFIEQFDLTSIAGARQGLRSAQNLIDRLARGRGSLGAFQSRLEAATAALGTAQLQTEAAQSRIMDADIATEAADLVRLNILQRAGASVLAQANLQPSLALKLLQN